MTFSNLACKKRKIIKNKKKLNLSQLGIIK